MRVDRNQIRAARAADLHDYLLQHHSDTVKRAGHNRLQNVEHDSLIITKGKGYCHNSISETGNGVDYLTKYLGYTFKDAVRALAAFCGTPEPVQAPVVYKRPESVSGAYKRVFAYLTITRKIPKDVVTRLISEKLLSEDPQHNCVFASSCCNYAELVGTLSDVRFKGIVPGSDSDGYWLMGNPRAQTVYICESAIDAVSLFCVARSHRDNSDLAYVSIGGLKPAAVRLLQEHFAECVLAVDRDPAGDVFSAEFPELRRIKPKLKDWNEDLCQIMNC